MLKLTRNPTHESEGQDFDAARVGAASLESD
jgi:hypothetical protein